MSIELFKLDGRVALATGGSQGLGLAMARGLAAAGATVVINGRDEAKLARALAASAAEGVTLHSAAFDITDAAAVADQLAQINTDLGPVDILVNNAGIQRRGAIEAYDEADWHAVLDTNLTGSFLVTRAVVGGSTGMIARKQGKIINICSVISEVGRKTITAYAASKGGLKMFTRALATELGAYNIQVNGIGPGYFTTEMNRPLIADEAFNAWICERTPAGRWGDPSELVGTAVFLASRASDYVNGQIIYVDGGILASL